ARYAKKASSLVDELRSLSGEYPDLVKMHDITGNRPDVDGAPPNDTTSSAGILRYRDPKDGPAFIPLRVWMPGKQPKPLSFTVTAQELGIDDDMMKTLAPIVARQPIAERISLVRDRVVRVSRLQSFLATGGTLPAHALGYWVVKKAGSATARAL